MGRTFEPQIVVLVLLMVVENSTCYKKAALCDFNEEIYARCKAPCVKQVTRNDVEVFYGTPHFFFYCFDRVGIKHWKTDSGSSFWLYEEFADRPTMSTYISLKQHHLNYNHTFQVWGRNEGPSGQFYSLVNKPCERKTHSQR